jgi:hypothetical protein
VKIVRNKNASLYQKSARTEHGPAGFKRGDCYMFQKNGLKNASVEKLCGGQLRLQGGAKFLKYTFSKTAHSAHA